ncbi:glycosyltransferase family 4 protein [Metabacillus malikii]|uniref:Glycosyltransferase involved in cell wall biosynthesis n=1 Tax=Metabacillus malikii TaxID=1504265 RepID=A0ABT9ZN04_9BACI|nr:glycosyltransferase family 4 protein [Metabacillus malikii]MDQ0233624.1 glycosyltransferase involved in cell wall biosynthesis [Metabacillus malikii]
MNKVETIRKTTEITVLLLTTEYSESLIGGLGRHVSDLINIGSNAVKYIVVTPSLTGTETYTYHHGAHIFRLVSYHQNSSDFFEHLLNLNFRYIKFISNELNLHYDIIHVHDWLTGISGIEIKKMAGKPLLATIHSTEKERKLGECSPLIEKITKYENKLISQADYIIVCSHYMKDLIESRHDNIEVIPNGVIPANYKITINQISHIKKLQLQKPYLLAMGRLVKEKGFHLLIEAYADLANEYIDYKLIIAGDGPYYNQLVQLTKDLHIQDRVMFTGFVNGTERNILLNNCKLLVVPSLYEPFGIISLEGMAVSKPVMAFNVGGLSEVLSENKGILINDLSKYALNEKLKDFLKNPDAYNDIILNGYEAVHNVYHIKQTIKKTVLVYKKLLKLSYH